MRAFFVICLTLGFAATLNACSQHEEGTTTITFWAMGREAEVVGQLLPEFEQENPEIRVRIQQIPWTSAHEKLLTAFAGDALPDIAQLGNTWLPEMATLGALVPLDDLIDHSPIIEEQDYFPGIWGTNIIDGTTYGIPWYIDTRLLFYRSDILAAAGVTQLPQNWQELKDALKQVKAHVGNERYAILLPLNEFEPLLAFALQQDTPLLAQDGRFGNFSSPDFKETLSFYSSMFEEGLAPAISNTVISNVWDEFAKGYFTFYITGPWNIGEFKKRMPEELKDAWNTAPLPGPKGPGASIAGGSSLVVFQTSPHKEAAQKLLEYLSRPDVQTRFHALTGDLPPRRSAWPNNDIYAAAFRDQLERAKPTPKVPEWERIVTEMRLVTELLVRGQFTIDEATAELDNRTDRILEKRRWMLAPEGEP